VQAYRDAKCCVGRNGRRQPAKKRTLPMPKFVITICATLYEPELILNEEMVRNGIIGGMVEQDVFDNPISDLRVPICVRSR
jgi:hypothetical protein